jgi:hypothetical protein
LVYFQLDGVEGAMSFRQLVISATAILSSAVSSTPL